MIQPEGNFYNKYESKNPIEKKLMKGFFDSIAGCLAITKGVHNILEAGCGEGHVTGFVRSYYDDQGELTKINAFDISEKCISLARSENPGINFYTGNMYDIKDADRSYDLVISSEVLEHMDDPERALSELVRVSGRYLLLSVPREPIWRVLNMARGKYLIDLGNTPGHVNHWSKNGFVRFLQEKQGHSWRVVKVFSPLPWTVVMCERE